MNTSPRSGCLLALLRSGGTIAVACSGHADESGSDIERRLSDLGRAQVVVMQAAVAKSMDVGMVMTALATRAIHTVSRTGWPDAVKSKELDIPSGTPVAAQIDRALRLLGRAPLSTYNLNPVTTLALEQWGYDAVSTMDIDLVGHVPDMKGRMLLVGCSHPALSQALVVAIGRAVYPEIGMKAVESVKLGEAEVLTLRLGDGAPLQLEHLNTARLEEIAGVKHIT